MKKLATHLVFYLALCCSITATAQGSKFNYRTYQGERGGTNGMKQPFDNAVGDSCVLLQNVGDYIQWSLVDSTNAIELRYSMEDGNGTAYTAPLTLKIRGVTKTFFPRVTNKYIWVYGFNNDPSEWTNTPGGTAHKPFDEVKVVLDSTYPPGAVIRFEKSTAADAAAWYRIDLMDAYRIGPPLQKSAVCATCIDITASPYNAVPNDNNSDATAFMNALTDAKAQGVGVWIPKGTFLFPQASNQEFRLGVGTKIIGAGMWYSILKGTNAMLWGNDRVEVAHFTVDKDEDVRSSTMYKSFFWNKLGKKSNIHDLYVCHGQLMSTPLDPTSDSSSFRNVIIRSMFAGGINLRGGHKNAVLDNIDIRGVGDDGLIIWQSDNQNCTIKNSTVAANYAGNGAFAVYGGSNTLIDSVMARNTYSSALRVSSKFLPAATAVHNNTVVRNLTALNCGNADSIWGGITIEADTAAVRNVTIENCIIRNSLRHGIIIKDFNKRVLGGDSMSITIRNTTVVNNLGYGAYLGQYGIARVTFSCLTTTNTTQGRVYDYPGNNITFTDGCPAALRSLNNEVIEQSKRNLEAGIRVFPNPTANWVMVSLQDYSNFDKIQVLDQYGSLMQEVVLSGKPQVLQLPTARLANGTYWILGVSRTGKAIAKKLVVQR